MSTSGRRKNGRHVQLKGAAAALPLHDPVGREVQVWQKFAARRRNYVPGDIVFGRGVNGGREFMM